MEVGLPASLFAMNRTVSLSPSMMCADPFALEEVVQAFEDEKVEWLHMDVMDGRYVPNYTLGPDFCQWVAKRTAIPQDVHLMVMDPHLRFSRFITAPGTRITFHPETLFQPVRLIEAIRSEGGSPGIALDPSMTLDSCRHLLPLVDQALLMTVSPGYAGQKLLPFTLDKISEARSFRDKEGLDFDISVDGAVSWEAAPEMAKRGANILVAGTSSIFSGGRVTREAIQRLRKSVVFP